MEHVLFLQDAQSSTVPKSVSLREAEMAAKYVNVNIHVRYVNMDVNLYQMQCVYIHVY